MKSKKASLSPESEEYLEAIYKLQERDGVAKTIQLAKELNVVPGSITNTIENLERQGLVTHEPYQGVKLTDKGAKLALKIVRRHRLAERFLSDILHVSWSKVHKLACKLEHAFTKDVSKSLEETLGNPKTCPHGNPIPSESGVIVKQHLEKLSFLKPKEKAIVMTITEEKPEILQKVEKIGLLPGAFVEIEKKEPAKKSLLVKVGEKHHVVGEEFASLVQVVPVSQRGRRQRRLNEPVYALKEEKVNAVPLAELEEGSRGYVVFLLGGCGLIRRLAEMGLTPGTEITVLKRCLFQGPMEISVRGVCVALGHGVAAKVFVRPL